MGSDMGDRQNDPDLLNDLAFCHRVTCYLDGESSPEELRELDAELQADASKRDTFVHLCLVRAALIRQGMAIRAEEPPADAVGALDDAVILPALREPDVEDPVRHTGPAVDPPAFAGVRRAAGRRPPGRWWVYGSGLAAVLAAGFGLTWAVRHDRPAGPTVAIVGPAAVPAPAAVVGPAAPQTTGGSHPPAPSPPAAVVTATAGVAVSGPDSLVPEMPLAAGRTVRLTAGAAELTFASGASVLVRAPAEVRVVDAGELVVDSGAVYAHVPPAARGFRVVAPGLDVVDRGTNFGVRTEAKATATEVHVFEGLVDATAVDAGGRPTAGPVEVTTGKAVGHAEAAAGTQPISVPFAPVGFSRDIADIRTPVGVRGTGVGLTAGNADPNWLVASMPGMASGQSQPALVLANPRSDYTASRPDARWVAPTARLSNAPPGRYVYRTTLDLTGYNVASASVTAVMSADDEVVDVRVNGTSVALPPSILKQVTWRSVAEVALAGARWKSGPNQVEVVVFNADSGRRMNPTGLLFGLKVTAALLVRR